MRKVVIQAEETASTQEANEQMIKILNSTYEKSDLKQVSDNWTQLDSEGRTLLLTLLEDFKDFFGGALGDWDTELINLDLNTDSKQFNSRYYTVPRINKEVFRKDLKR